MVDPVFTDGSYPRPAGSFPEGPVAARPVVLTTFVGRENDVAAVVARLHHPSARLLTLTGPGGIGKTRLASRAIETLKPVDFGEIAWVSLAPVRDPDHVATTIAQALNLPLVAGLSPWEQMQAALASRPLLLVLDNLEQVAGGIASPLASLLGSCPALKILATSRVPLRVSGEQVVPVSPLSPGSARELFTVRAHAIDPTLTVTDDTIRTIDAICSRLDRLPLAIELAAARVQALPPPALLSRLDRRLDILVSGPRDVEPRLRAMRESIAWSHDLLPASCQILFRRLGVFVGEFTLEGAAAVSDEDVDVLHDLSALLAASLVARVTGTDVAPRYAMLETIREFAVEQLERSGETGLARRRHARHMVQLAEGLWDPGGWVATERILQQLQPEIDNFRLALEWLVRHEPVEALRLVGALQDFWMYFGSLHEGWHWVTVTAVAAPEAPAWIRVRALITTARIALDRQGFEQAEAAAAEAIAISNGQLDEELQFRLMEVPRLAALHRGDFKLARQLFAEELSRAEQEGLYMRVAVATMNLGRVALLAGDPERAEALLQEALALHQQHSTPIGVAFGRTYLGEAQIALGKERQGFINVRSAFGAFLDAGFLAMAAFCLEIMAETLVQSHPDAAVRLLGMVETLPPGISSRRSDEDLVLQARILDTALTALGELAFRTAWSEGSDLPWSSVRAVVEALPEPGSPPGLSMPADASHGLTPRELEVLRLVAAGHSNREIAATLFISVPTVKRHITTILGKLQVPSRSAATAYAHTYNLLEPGRKPHG